MKHTLPLLTLLLGAPLVPQALAQPSASTSTASGFPVIDIANIAQHIVDLALQKIQTKIFRRTRQEAATHYRRVTQHVGVTLFQGGPAHRALRGRVIDMCRGAAASEPICQAGGSRQLLRGMYENIYAPAYAPGVPEKEQDSAAAARMEEIVFNTAREIEQIRADIALLEGQITTLNDLLADVLLQPAATTSNRQGDIKQLQVAIAAKGAVVRALHARADVLRAQHGVVRGLYAQQQAGRSAAKVQRGAQEFMGGSIPPPFIPAVQYGGARKLLRFPGLSQN